MLRPHVQFGAGPPGCLGNDLSGNHEFNIGALPRKPPGAATSEQLAATTNCKWRHVRAKIRRSSELDALHCARISPACGDLVLAKLPFRPTACRVSAEGFRRMSTFSTREESDALIIQFDNVEGLNDF